MLTFTPELVLDIIRHADPDVANDLELDPESLETIAEEINEDSNIQDTIADLLD
mgnify:CR=1 FL=1